MQERELQSTKLFVKYELCQDIGTKFKTDKNQRSHWIVDNGTLTDLIVQAKKDFPLVDPDFVVSNYMINARLKANNLQVWNPVTASRILDLTVVGQLHNAGVQTEFTMKYQPILKWHERMSTDWSSCWYPINYCRPQRGWRRGYIIMTSHCSVEGAGGEDSRGIIKS